MELRARNEKGQVSPLHMDDDMMPSFSRDRDSGSEEAGTASTSSGGGTTSGRRKSSKRRSPSPLSAPLHRRNSSLDSDRSYVVIENQPEAPPAVYGCGRCRYTPNGCASCSPAKLEAYKRRKLAEGSPGSKRVLRSKASRAQALANPAAAAAGGKQRDRATGRRGRSSSHPSGAAALVGTPRAVLTAQELLELGPFKDRIVEVRDCEGRILTTGVIRAGGLIECQSAKSGRGGKGGAVMMRYGDFEDHAFEGLAHREEDAVISRGQKIFLSNGQTLMDFVYALNSGFVEHYTCEDLHRFTGATMAQSSSCAHVQGSLSTLAKATTSFCQANSKLASPQFQIRGWAKPKKSRAPCGCASSYLTTFKCNSGCPSTSRGGQAPLSCAACPQILPAHSLADQAQGGRAPRKGMKAGKTDPLCAACKIQGKLNPKSSAGKAALAKCTELLGELDRITGGCCLCHVPDFDRGSTLSKNTSIMCDQCEREFHVGCLEKEKMCSLKHIPKGTWFCSKKCRGVNQALQRRRQLGRHTVRTTAEGRTRTKATETSANFYTCEVLCGEGKTARSKASLSEALEILQESFDPLPHALTGADLLPIMARAETCADHDYTTVHTILLRYREEAVCACVIRICGQFLAEIPFVATKQRARNRGHCRQMFKVIEALLSDLGVQQYCLPAAAGQAMNTWIKHFGFRVMVDSEFRQVRADFRILLFPGTTVLVKAVPREEEL